MGKNDSSRESVPVAFVQLDSGTVYAVTKPAPKPKRGKVFKPSDKGEVYDRASELWEAHLRHVGHE
jgi:hypothetical protein